MKKFLIILLLATLFYCQSGKESREDNLLTFRQFPLPVPEHNSLMYQWEKKNVLDSRLIDDMETETGWKVTGIGEMTYTTDRSKDGKKSLRFRTSLRDEEHYKKNRTEWGSFGGTQGGNASVQLLFAEPQDWSDYNRISFWVYVHPADMMTYCLYLHIENEGTVYNATTPRKDHFIQDLKPGEWNHVLFEMPHLQRDRITEFEINQMLTGHNPEEEGIVTYDINKLELQKVNTDQFEGWNVAPGTVSFSHIGYRPGDKKVAMAGSGAGSVFQLVDRGDNIVYTGDVRIVKNENGEFHQLDFSDFSVPGIYAIRTGDLESGRFPIDENIWLQPVFKAINFFFCERCGYNVPGIHLECHKDWQAAVSSRSKWDKADYREASWGATSSLLLAKMTGEEKYRECAVMFGKLLVSCQEQQFIDGIPITGYFYENTDRERVIHNHHAAFEEAPLIALSMLCRELPDHENWIDWYSAVVLHSEYFMKRGSLIAAPYYHLPNSVWKESNIIAEKDSAVRSDMLRQFNDGIRLGSQYVLRTFPIYRDGLFHGSTNIQMSSAWALAEASRLRRDPEGMLLLGKQLEWIFGANPFGQSLMYGAGYGFAPHFAYCLKDIVGSLPVGMDCMSGDMPHWCATNTATSKEIWVEPVNRFLGAVSIYAADGIMPNPGKAGAKGAEIRTEASRTVDGTININVSITGSGRHSIDLKTFNATANTTSQQFELTGNSTIETTLKLKITDKNKPYVAVITLDGNPESRNEIVGSYVDFTLGN
jgi:hypothetical protein